MSAPQLHLHFEIANKATGLIEGLGNRTDPSLYINYQLAREKDQDGKKQT